MHAWVPRRSSGGGAAGSTAVHHGAVHLCLWVKLGGDGIGALLQLGAQRVRHEAGAQGVGPARLPFHHRPVRAATCTRPPPTCSAKLHTLLSSILPTHTWCTLCVLSSCLETCD